MTTLQARQKPSFDGYSVAEQILNDPESWRRESGRDWASSSDRGSDDEFTPGAGPFGGLRTGKRKPRPPSFTLKPFHKKFNLMPVNEPSPIPPSNVTTPSSVYKSPPGSAPESPFDIEKIYGIDVDDIYGDIYGSDEDVDDLPLVQSRSGWTGVAEQEAFDRSKALARLLESSKTVTAEVTELVEQRLSLLLGQPNIFRAFATPQDVEFELEGEMFTPATGLATESFIPSPPSSYSTASDCAANSTRLSLKHGLRVSTTKTTTTTVIAVKTPSTSSSVGVAIISAVSQTSGYSIFDLYGTPKASPDRVPKSAGLVPSPPNTSRNLVPKTSLPTTTTFSVTSSQPPPAPASAFAAQFSITSLRSDQSKIIELPTESTAKIPPTLSIVTSVPSRLAYQQKATKKDVAPLMFSKKGKSNASGKNSPRPLPKLPRSLTPPPAVPPLPSSVTSVPIPPVPELPTNEAMEGASTQPRRDIRKWAVKAAHSSSPPRRLSDEPLLPLPQTEETTPDTTPEDSAEKTNMTVPSIDVQGVSQGEEHVTTDQEKEDETRQPRSENRMKTGKLRSVTPPPRGSRPQKKKSGLSPVPPLPTSVKSPLLSPSKELTPVSGDVANTTTSNLPSSSTLSPFLASSPFPGPSSVSSASSFPSPSAFPLPPPSVPSTVEQNEASASVQDVPVVTLTTDHVPKPVQVDERAERKLSLDNLIKLLDNKGKGSAAAVEPPVIHVSTEAENKGSSISAAPVSNEGTVVAQAEEASGTRKPSNSRTPSLVVSTASVADIVEQAYASGIPPVDDNSPEVMLLRADSLKRRENAPVSPTSHGRSHSDVVGSKPKKALRHSRSAVQLGSKASISNLASLFQHDVPLPDRSLLSRRTPGSSVDERPLVADAFTKVDVAPSPKVASPNTQRRGAGDEGLASWKPPSTWGSSPTTTQAPSSFTRPERPQRALSRIPSEILTVGASAIGRSLEVPASSRPLSRSSSASATLMPSPVSAEKPALSPSPAVKEISRAQTPVPSSNTLTVDVPPRRAITPTPPTPSATPSRAHRRSVSEKIPESTTTAFVAKRERRRAPTPTPAERRLLAELPASSKDTPAPSEMQASGSSGRQRRGPTPPPLDRRPLRSVDMPLPPLPTSVVSNMASPRSTPTHSPKPSADGRTEVTRRVLTPTPSDRKASLDNLPPVPSIPQSTSDGTSPARQEPRRVPAPTLIGRSRSATVSVPQGAPVLPLPSALKPSHRATPTHSPNASIDDRRRRSPTPLGSRPPSDMPAVPAVPVPDASVLARRMRKPSISASSRAAHTSSGVSIDSGYESSSSMKRFAQPTVSSSAKLRELAGPGVVPPPVPPKSESRGRVKFRQDSPPRGSRGRSVPREERSIESRSQKEELRGRERPSSPTRGRGRSVGRPDEDIRAAPISSSSRSRSVGPARAEVTSKTRKRTSSLSVAPPPLPSSRLMVPELPSRAPSPSGSMIRGRVSPFPTYKLSSSLTAF
ncbi:hypothetical protein PM082_021465 [Marasmius tenuissimus]|nr:hypothetical protein PM082_021465 [Marasmius tenuissimus]